MSTEVEVIDHDLSGLTPLQAAFVRHYIADPERNASEAARRAGYSENGIGSLAYRLIRHPAVRAAIAVIDEERFELAKREIGVTSLGVIRNIAQTAFADPRKLFNEDGSPKAIHELDDDIAMAIESVEVVEQYQGSGEERLFTGYVKKYKLARRSPAQDMLMKHLNAYAADNKSKGEAIVSALGSLLQDMKRSALPIAEEVEADRGV